jgi:toxin FitB
MFVLDTNVISEIFTPAPSPTVMAWLNARSRSAYWVTAISRAELLFGMHIMPDGKRKQSLANFIQAFFQNSITNGILAFGEHEADAFAELVAHRRRVGQPIGEFDGQIAAIAVVRRFAVVTRNVRDFTDCGIDVINPWEAAP